MASKADTEQNSAMSAGPIIPTATSGSETERVRRIYDRVASRYDGVIAWSEKIFFGNGRAWVCPQAGGAVLEIAFGTGRNLPYYPRDVRLTGIELSREMLAIARRRAQRLGHDVDLHLGDAQSLPFPDQCFDTVVCTLALCTIPDDWQAIAEASRVLRPGGRLLWLEHVRSPVLLVQAVQRLVDPLAVRIQGDHLLRTPLDHLRTLGLKIDQMQRSKWGMVERVSARKPV